MKKTMIAGAFLLLALSFTRTYASSLPEGCRAGDSFSATTGHSCAAPQNACAPGDLYSSETGLPCSSGFLPGCSSTAGYSVLTGSKCDGSTASQELISQLKQIIQNTMPKQTEPTVTVPVTPVQTVETNANNPVPLSPEQQKQKIASDYVSVIRSRFPNAVPYGTMNMPSGHAGTEFLENQGSENVVAEQWGNNDGTFTWQWADGTPIVLNQ